MDKTNHSPVSNSLPEKCCGHCAHGREIVDTGTMRRMIQCRALPGTVALINTPTGTQMQTLCPVLSPDWDCDLFVPGTPVPAKPTAAN